MAGRGSASASSRSKQGTRGTARAGKRKGEVAEADVPETKRGASRPRVTVNEGGVDAKRRTVGEASYRTQVEGKHWSSGARAISTSSDGRHSMEDSQGEKTDSISMGAATQFPIPVSRSQTSIRTDTSFPSPRSAPFLHPLRHKHGGQWNQAYFDQHDEDDEDRHPISALEGDDGGEEKEYSDTPRDGDRSYQSDQTRSSFFPPANRQGRDLHPYLYMGGKTGGRQEADETPHGVPETTTLLQQELEQSPSPLVSKPRADMPRWYDGTPEGDLRHEMSRSRLGMAATRWDGVSDCHEEADTGDRTCRYPRTNQLSGAHRAEEFSSVTASLHHQENTRGQPGNWQKEWEIPFDQSKSRRCAQRPSTNHAPHHERIGSSLGGARLIDESGVERLDNSREMVRAPPTPFHTSLLFFDCLAHFPIKQVQPR
mmetsp:Transcript_20127/g.51354  ORF Transcript_20127/g.51354 Transcript_20127/m.51354 type:complete len:427 (+) Transcript_20127:613-1893(+)